MLWNNAFDPSAIATCASCVEGAGLTVNVVMCPVEIQAGASYAIRDRGECILDTRTLAYVLCLAKGNVDFVL